MELHAFLAIVLLLLLLLSLFLLLLMLFILKISFSLQMLLLQMEGNVRCLCDSIRICRVETELYSVYFSSTAREREREVISSSKVICFYVCVLLAIAKCIFVCVHCMSSSSSSFLCPNGQQAHTQPLTGHLDTIGSSSQHTLYLSEQVYKLLLFVKRVSCVLFNVTLLLVWFVQSYPPRHFVWKDLFVLFVCFNGHTVYY